MYMSICLHVCMCVMCVPGSGGCQKISWNRTYRQVWDTMWVLGTKLRSSARVISVLNLWANLSSPKFHFLWLHSTDRHLTSHTLILLFICCFLVVIFHFFMAVFLAYNIVPDMQCIGNESLLKKYVMESLSQHSSWYIAVVCWTERDSHSEHHHLYLFLEIFRAMPLQI